MTLKSQTQKLHTLLLLITHCLELSLLAVSSYKGGRDYAVLSGQLYIQLRLKGFWVLGDS